MKVKVSSLKHHPKNKEIYTLSSIEELMESISEVGLLQPLTIDTRNQVISGNRRFESIKRLGWKEVEVEVKEVKEEEEELLLQSTLHFFRYYIIVYFIPYRIHNTVKGFHTICIPRNPFFPSIFCVPVSKVFFFLI